jgi:hypothetical protein
MFAHLDAEQRQALRVSIEADPHSLAEGLPPGFAGRVIVALDSLDSLAMIDDDSAPTAAVRRVAASLLRRVAGRAA